MARMREAFSFLAGLLVLLATSAAWPASITGMVTNGTGKNGRIYLVVCYSTGDPTDFGTSISTPGPFTISGVDPGTYSVRAYVDTTGTGFQHANDPTGASATVPVTSADGSVPVGSFPVTLPGFTQPRAPQPLVYRGDGGNIVLWSGPRSSNDLPVAERYTVSWSGSGSDTDISGTRDVGSGDKDFFVHIGGGGSLYYRVTAWVGGSFAHSAWAQVTPASGSGSVTGSIQFPGVQVTGPLMVALADESADPPKFHVVVVQNPVSGGTYTATNVAPGTYRVHPILDLNDNGTYDSGDIGPPDSSNFNRQVTVSTSQVTAPTITLANENASVLLTTNHGMNDQYEYNEWYAIQLSVQSMKKHVVRVRIEPGPQIGEALDVSVNENQFQLWRSVDSRPTVGQAYQVQVAYADGSSESLTRSVTAVLDGFATPIAPIGLINDATPIFSWSAPAPAPADFLYSIWVDPVEGYDVIWDAGGIPKTQTAIEYGQQGDVLQQSLTEDVSYHWAITVTDTLGNQAQRQSTFRYTGRPAIGGFWPPGGLAGTTVTISGINFIPDPTQHAVYFDGVQGMVTSATANSLTVTVPAGAQLSGPIRVVTAGSTLFSEDNFILQAPVAITGIVRTRDELPIAGAKVEVAGQPAVSVLTGANGAFTLEPLFVGGTAALKITKSGYVPTYSSPLPIQGEIDLTPYPHHLYTQDELTGWGGTPGKGVLIGKVLTSGVTPSPVGGAVVNATSSMNFGSPYPVSYYSGTGDTPGGSATYDNGIFVVPNASNYDWVNVTATKPQWNFNHTGFPIRANAVTEGALFGSTFSPNISSFTPQSGKAGTAVVITGSYFGATAGENLVKFNGVTAEVTAASSASLTVTVPAGATTGSITVTTAGGTATSGSNFTRRYTLLASVSGSGGALGTVTSIPVGISCRGTMNCTLDLDQGTQVQMLATADGGAALTSWGGACSGAGSCSFAMNSDKTVTATFGSLLYIKKGDLYYSLLQSAFDAAANGDNIQARAVVLTGNAWTFDRPAAQVKLKGGYDNSFQTNSGFTTLFGRLNLQGGTLRVERIRIR